MCGIVGYVGKKKVVPVIIEGLRRLEYRGYDSAGIAVAGGPEGLTLRRAPGKLRNLEAVIAERAHQLQTAAGLYAKAFGILQATRPAGNISESVAKLYAGVLSKLHRGREAKQVVQEAAGLRVP